VKAGQGRRRSRLDPLETYSAAAEMLGILMTVPHPADSAEAAVILQKAGVRVFYDDFERVSLWGKDLYEHFD
jgi:ABC-type uncharacterized transport system YnjBCD permease subunit